MVYTVIDRQNVLDRMLMYAYWKNRRDELIMKGLAAGIPIWQIAREMQINRSVIYRVKRASEVTRKVVK
jgi:hypothetical protein